MDIFTTDNVRVDASATSQDEIFASIAAFAAERGYTDDAAGIVEGMRTRESLSSTALMDGIAIPHAKHAAVTSAALLVQRFDRPVDWTDGEPVRVTLTMLVPEAEAGTTHLQLLAKVSRALIEDEVRETLSTGTAEQVYALLNERVA